MLIKLALMPWYLQAYLDMAYHRTEAQKKEAGRVTNVEYQKKIAAVFYYLCVVALQYAAPIILCLYLTFMYKTLGAYSWIGMFKEPESYGEPQTTQLPYAAQLPEDSDSIAKSAQDFSLALNNLKTVFSVEVFRGLLGFSTWWCCFVYFAATSVGLIYQSYFTVV